MPFRTWSQWLTHVRAKFRNGSASSATARPAAQRRPAIMQLEERRVLSVNVGLEPATGELAITGTPQNDTVEVRLLSDTELEVHIESGSQSETQVFQRADVNHITFEGGDGDDRFVNATDIASTANGDGTGKKRTIAEGRKLGDAMLDEFDRVCGLKNLRVLHLNDSIGTRGSNLDRHAHIGEGNVAMGAFKAVANRPELGGVPMILETPKGEDEEGTAWDTINLRRLRKLVD
ncbi:MAG: hypothetical protein KDA42_18560 [Planctomycetales bacterium]|nr:hypothetical protein [Planctomycetales bacterium]